MEDNTQEGRKRLIEEYLNRTHIADDEDELSEGEETIPDGEQVEQEIETMPAELATLIGIRQQTRAEANGQKKKKKKKKSKTANLPEAGTVLDDDYVEKHTEDVIENPFDTELPLSQRVEYAIWKYRKNHKFSEEKRTIFDAYLKFGGIKTGPNMFLGRATSADTPEDPEAVMDFEAAKLAIDTVPDELEEGVEVNFSEVAQVFFGNTFNRSSRFIRLQDFIDGPILIDAFLRYLQIRNVAPEYAEDIAKARSIVAEAKIQLPKCKQASAFMPGAYNEACSKLFSGEGIIDDTSWMSQANFQREMLSFVKETVVSNSEDTKKIVQARIKNPDNVKLIETKADIPIKILEISPFSPDADLNELVKVKFGNYHETQGDQETYDIYFEKEIAQHLMNGMVIELASISRLSNGDYYLGRAERLNPSFYMEDDCIQEEELDY